MSYIYLALGFVIGIIFIGMGKNARHRKAIPYEVNKKLKSSKRMDEYNKWCNTEATADTIIGCGLMLFGFSTTFTDSNAAVSGIIALISLAVFIFGYIKRLANNKKHLGHFFVR